MSLPDRARCHGSVRNAGLRGGFRRFVAGKNTTEIRRLRERGEEPGVREIAPTVPRVLSDICDRALATLWESTRFTGEIVATALALYVVNGASDRYEAFRV